MISKKNKIESIDDYIKDFPSNIQNILREIRRAIKKAVPNAEESIGYKISTFKLNGNLVHFAAFQNHIGFYPGSKAIKVFSKELSDYETSKGTIRFPLNKRIPLALIIRITKHKVKENLKNRK